MPTTPAVSALVIGEALIDAVHDRSGNVTEHPGGSPANVALTLGRLEHDATLLTWYADDSRGESITQWLVDSNVTVDAASVAAARTSVAAAHLQVDGSAQYDFDLEWDIDAASIEVEKYEIVHTGSIAALLEPGGSKVLELLRRAQPHATITYDPNARPTLMGSPDIARPIIEQYVQLADVVKVSDEDLEWLYPDQAPLNVARRWQEEGTAIVVVTQGGDGATGFAASGSVHINTPKVTVADTVGAGDSFMGALIYGLGQHNLLGKNGRNEMSAINGDTLKSVLEQCAKVAAVTVSRSGANPPRLVELND